MKYLLVICKNSIFTYEAVGNGFLPQMIEGSKKYSYNINTVNDDMDAYLQALANEKNLGTVARLEFDVVEGTDVFCNNAIINVLEKYIDKKYNINTAIAKAIGKLSRDKNLLIDQYGVNYDDISYIMIDNEIKKQPYNLLAYRVECDDLVDLMDM